MPNNIGTIQNLAHNVQRIAAARRAYSDAKLLVAVQMILLVAVPVLGSIAVLFAPGGKAMLATASIAITILDIAMVDRLQRNFLRLGALFQEEFDCEVLQIPWDPFLIGRRPAPEDILVRASNLLASPSSAALRDWYPDVSKVSIEFGRVICQRTNLWYDAQLRKRYSYCALGIAIVLSVFLVLVGTASGLPFDEWVLRVFAPALPILSWGLKEYYRQRDAADALTKLFDAARELWDDALARKRKSALERRCRELQTAIFQRRSITPPIFDWLYQLMRPRLEDRMNANAETMIEEALQADRE